MVTKLQKIIFQGAEAIISLDETNNQIIKHRIKKSYRIKEIDEKLRFRRTKAEAKIINKLNSVINVPKIIKVDKENIIMENIEGKKLSDYLEELDYKTICKQIGEILTKLHNQNIIHGDLTTSNMILADKDKQIYLIDFGLGFHSQKIEDKAVDLHLLKQALDAKHYKINEQAFKIIIDNYNPEKKKEILQRITAIEKRGRYRH
ncbi:MAG: KEOPS complex kinase/ATPase Bud32 [Nanoarchaeota archaeon]